MKEQISRRNNRLLASTGAILGTVALIGLTANVSNQETVADRFDASIEQAYANLDESALADLDVQQLEGSVIVSREGNVRTTPEKPIESGENIVEEYSGLGDSEFVLEDPILYENPNSNDGVWYGAKNEAGEFVWVNERAVKEVIGQTEAADITLPNTAYISTNSTSS